MLLSFTDSILREASRNDLLPESIISGTQVGQVRFMIVGLGLTLLIIFPPQGIFVDRRSPALDAHLRAGRSRPGHPGPHARHPPNCPPHHPPPTTSHPRPTP